MFCFSKLETRLRLCSVIDVLASFSAGTLLPPGPKFQTIIGHLVSSISGASSGPLLHGTVASSKVWHYLKSSNAELSSTVFCGLLELLLKIKKNSQDLPLLIHKLQFEHEDHVNQSMCFTACCTRTPCSQLIYSQSHGRSIKMELQEFSVLL